MIGNLISLAIFVLVLASFWKIFVKADEPGWLAIIPIVNLFILVKIAGKEWWWALLLFIPLINIVIVFILCLAHAERFGKGVGFAIGLFFLGIVFYPILAFSDAEYRAA